MRAVATALLALLLSATALTQTQAPISAENRELIMRFVSASEAERISILAAEPRMVEPQFLEDLARAGNLQRTSGSLDLAEAVYRSLLFIGERNALPKTISIAYNNLGTVYGGRGDLEQATSFLHQAMALSEKINDPLGVEAGWANLAIVQRRLGELDLAEASVRRALAFAEQSNNKGMMGRTLNTLGTIYNSRGDGARAQEILLQSLRLKEEAGLDAREINTTLTNLGGILDEQGDYAQALHQYHRGLELMQKAGLPDAAMSSTLNNIGHSYEQLRQVDEARRYYARALAGAEASGERGRTATILANLGRLEHREGRLDEAESLHRQALALRETSSDRIGLIESLTSMARLLDYRDRAAEGLPYIVRAVSLSQESRLLNQLWKAQFSAGHIHASLGDFEKAAAEYSAAIETIERLRQAAAGGDDGRRQFMSERVTPYYGLATIKAAAGDTWGALSVIEQSRARALVDIIGSGRQPTRQLSDAQQREEHKLLQAIASLAETIDSESRRARPNMARLASLDAELTKARVARDAFTAELYTEQPDLGFARGLAPAITRAQLAALIDPSTAIVTFAFDVESPSVYLIRRDGADVRITAKALAMTRRALAEQADAFSVKIASRDLGFAAAGRQLYAALLGPIDAELAGVKHVVMIPDGQLWTVPFQALITPRGQFMLEERAVSYTPSLSALEALEKRRASRGARAPFLLALGDPVAAASTATAATRGETGRLPQAAREVESLGALYGRSRSRVLTATAASETALRNNLARASIVHLATHGVLDDRNPMYSRLMLSPDRANAVGGATLDHTADGRLEAWEILDMGFTADLAVLSACKTARGGLGGGEGVIGLSWSIFAAGASTAVVSQWEVDSTSTTRLMIAFHQQRLRATGPNASAALRSAALSVMKTPAYRHPFYWAGFIAVGAR